MVASDAARSGIVRTLRAWFAVLLGVLAMQAAWAEDPVRVYAAASLTDAFGELGQLWQQAGHPAPTLVFAGSGTLAKQIDAGAPADVFASADPAWMDYLAQHGRIDLPTRHYLLGNTLVLIAPLDGPTPAIEWRRDFPIASAFQGKLCTGEPGVVPVGIYAREALQSLGWWDGLKDRIVGTDDVRAALAFVERGECVLGIVYATDARVSRKVRVVAEFPASTHSPIVYPVALVRDGRPEARAFLQFLATPAAAAVFVHDGFVVLPP